MAKKKDKDVELISQVNLIQDEYCSELETDPKYSLKVDPEEKYGLSELQKKFVEHYVNYKNIGMAAELTGIDMDTAKAYITSYPIQAEVRRINLALYQRQFYNKLLTVDEIGGYLTSLLTDAVVEADKMNSKDKLRIIALMIELNKLKAESMKNPTILTEKDLDVDIKDLSVKTIKRLLETNSSSTKTDIIDKLPNSEDLTPEEAAYLSSIPTKELLNLIEETED